MSQWASLEATFSGKGVTEWTVTDGMPTGSESGPTAHKMKDGSWWVEGRLRDVSDYDSPAVLAWFIKAAEWAESAELTWDVDRGPRYRYRWDTDGLTRVKGVLDL